MQNENNRTFLSTLEKFIDICINFGSFFAMYPFAVLILGEATVSVSSFKTLVFILAAAFIQIFVFSFFKLYGNIPFVKAQLLVIRILLVNILFYAIALLVILVFADGGVREFMAVWLALVFAASSALLVFKKRLIIHLVIAFRKRSYHLRRVVIVGDNTATVRDFVKQVGLNPQHGIMIIGYVGNKTHDSVGCDKLGGFEDLERVLDEHRPHNVVFAIDTYNKKRLISMVNLCNDRCIKVYFLPVIYGFFKSERQITSVGTLPVINVHSTPLDNAFNAFLKRTVDIVGSILLIILTSPIMLVAAIGVRLSSPGPIFFKQERVGKLGRPFTMLKFRSMRVNSYSDNAWTTDNDPRKTRFGSFMRKTSIDELPQLFNVLAGSMSLVGPRPEIPHFVEYFKDIIPLYMVKHYVKPGLTGLAQVRGLRGDTSVEDRILADIEYIENWSLIKDIGIILYTPFKAINKHERYDRNETVMGIDSSGTRSDEELASRIAAGAHKKRKIKGSRVPTEQGQNASDGDTAAGENAVGAEPRHAGKRILYAASTTSHINSFHLKYIEALRADGYDVRVMAGGRGADYDIPFEKKMISAANTACRAQIKRILSKEEFDIIILNTTLAAFHIRMALPKKNRPRVVNVVHGYLFSRNVGFFRRKILLLCERLLAKKTDAIIVMNEEDGRIAERYKLCRERVYFTRGMGARLKPSEKSREDVRRECNDTDRFVLCFVGELSERKNQEFLIYAMKKIRREIPEAALWLIGEGADGEVLRNLSLSLGLGGAVRFLGRRENPHDYMRGCDLYVSASLIEGMPFNVIEAMACGCTTVATRIKGHEDLIKQGENGYLYECGDMGAFVGLVKRIYTEGAGFSPDAPRCASELYSFDKVFSDTLGTIKESISK